MTDAQKMAFEAATKITANSVQVFNIAQAPECAEDVATYFETLYDRLLSIATSNSPSSEQ